MEKRLDLLIQAGFVKRPSDLYKLTKQELLSLPLIKDKMADKLLSNIEASKSIDIISFLSGLGIEGAGELLGNAFFLVMRASIKY